MVITNDEYFVFMFRSLNLITNNRKVFYSYPWIIFHIIFFTTDSTMSCCKSDILLYILFSYIAPKSKQNICV